MIRAPAPVMGQAGSMPAGGMTVACAAANDDDECIEVRQMMKPGVDEFGFTRSQRLSMADAELAAGRAIGNQWQYADGFPTPRMRDEYCGTLNSAAALFYVEGLRLLARRVSRLAREADVPRAWADFDRLNTKAI